MHRSGSTSRASDEFFMSVTPPTGGKGSSPGRRSTAEMMDQLPKYDPQSEFAKKEVARVRSAESAVHAVPVVLIVCAIVLCFFSSQQIDVVNKGDSIVARIENMTNGGL